MSLDFISGFAAWNAAPAAVVGPDPHWANVSLLIQPTAADFAAGSYPADATGKALTYAGGAALTSSSAVTGGAGVAFAGFGASLAFPVGAGFTFDGDFTIEMLLTLNASATYTVLDLRAANAAQAWAVSINAGSPSFQLYNGASYGVNVSLGVGAPVYLALRRSGSDLSFHKDGVSQGQVTLAGTLTPAGGVGYLAGPLVNGFNGTAHALRITKGVARAVVQPTALWPTS